MERNRRAGAASGSGVVLATRRQRGRNPSDEEDKMEETSEIRFGKRPKKDIYGLSPSYLSASANSLNKRKRWGIAQDTQPSGHHAEAHESTEEPKADDDDAPSSLPHHQKHLKSRVQSQEDKFFMDFSAVPRKPRSAILLSSRFTPTTRKPQDLCSTQQRSPVTTLNGSSSPYGSFPQNSRKRLKPSGMEHHSMKVSQVSHVSAVSDQEAEVAEALFVLARSTPSHAGVLDSKLEAKLGTEAKCASSSATPLCFVGAPSSLGPDFASAVPKGKRPRVVAEKKDGKSPIVSSPSELVHSSVGETELESALQRAHSLAGEGHSFPSETSNSKILAGSPHCVPRWPRHMKETTPKGLEEQCGDHSGAKKIKQETQNADMEERQPEVCIAKRTSTATQENTVDSLGNRDEALTKPHFSSRSDAIQGCNGCISMSEIDLMTTSTIRKSEALHENGGELSIKGLNIDNGYLKLKGRAAGRIQGANEEIEEQKEQPTFETVRRLQHGDVKEEDHSSKPSPNRKNNDTGNSSVSSCFSSLSSTAVSRHAPVGLAGWMSGFSQLGYHGSSATSWAAATSSLSIDMKAAHPAMQLPHAAISSPVPKMKSCATHVYVAHYIHREQQAARHSLWSAALCRATTYNLNVPPAKQLDNDKPREAYTGFTQQKAQTHQTEPSVAYNMSQSGMRRMASSGTTHGSSVAGSISASNLPPSSRASSESSMVTASGHAMAAHAQYLQTMMQQSGFASFPYPVNGPPGQAAQFFNGPFYQPHMFPHLQPLAQQAANVLPMHKQQQAKGASSSAVEHQQAQAILQSPSQSQQQPQKLVETSASESSAHLERESKDLSLMATSGGGHIGKSQQASASLSSGQQQHFSSQNTLSSTGHQVKGMDPSFSSTPAMIVISKQPGTRPLGLLSAASKSATECDGLLPGSHKRGHNQRTSHEAASLNNDNAFTAEGQDYIEDQRVTIKQGAAHCDLPKASVEPSSQPFNGSSPNANGPSVNDVGLILRSASVSGSQSCKLAPSLVDEGSSPASQQLSSLLEAKMGRNHVCSSTLGAPTGLDSERGSDALCEAAEAEKSNCSDFPSGATILETPTSLGEYSKPTLDGGIQQGFSSAAIFSCSLPSQTTVASS